MLFRTATRTAESDDDTESDHAESADEDTTTVDDGGTAVAEENEDPDDAATNTERQWRSPQRLALCLGTLMVLALGALGGWLSYQTYQSHQGAAQSAQFLAVGRQAAINLTTIDWDHADADVQRILDSATGTFYDDFAQRSAPFIEVVKQAQSKSAGTPTASGLESATADTAQVLVAMSVKTTSAGSQEPTSRSWRMRIDVQKVGDDVKVSKVEFVP